MTKKIQTIEELMNVLQIGTFTLTTPEPEFDPLYEQKFYVHISKSQLQIVAISPEAIDTKDVISVEIETNLAKQFLGGEENTKNWGVAFKDEEYKLVKLSTLKEFFNNRIDVINIVELSILKRENWNYHDVRLLIDRKNNQIIIEYDGDRINNTTEKLKLYFTREGDPSYLKCAFTLDVNILNTIMIDNKLDSWPNPIVLPIHDVNDLSIFSIKSSFKIAIQEYEKTNY